MQIEAGQDERVTHSHGGARPGAGRLPGVPNKPLNERRERAPRVLQVPEEVAAWRKALKFAEDKQDARTMADILQKIHENRRGKPYVQPDPNARQRKPDDNRLLVAIQNIMPGAKRISTAIDTDDLPTRKRKPRALNKANSK